MFKYVFGFSVRRRPEAKLRRRKNILYMPFSLLHRFQNYTKTKKLRLKYEIKNDE